MPDLSTASSRPSLRPLRAALVLLGLLTGLAPAHATYPGENGPIVFSYDSPRAIGKVQPGKNTVTRLTDGHKPRVSPNGRQIAFTRGPNRDIHVMNMDGTNIVQLTSGVFTEALTWTPDGSRVAYSTYDKDGASLWTIRPDGTENARLQDLWPGMRVELPSMDWSPVSDDIVFTSAYRTMMIRALDTKMPRELKHLDASPSWTPDGQAIVYSTSGTIGLINADGTHDRTLPLNGSPGRVPMSPDGSQLAGSFGATLGKAPLVTVSIQGGQVNDVWPVVALETDWARVPRNCHATTLQGGGGVLAGDVDAYVDQCAIAVSPGPAKPSGVLAMALVVGTDGRVYARALRTSSVGAPAWGPATLVPGGERNPAGIRALKLAIAGTRDGSYHAVIINAADKALYHAMQDPSGQWSGFTRLDGYGGAPSFQARDVVITTAGGPVGIPGNLQVVANGLERGDLFHRFRGTSGMWSPFQPVPGSQGKVTQSLAISTSDDLYANVLAVTTTAADSPARLEQVLRDPVGNWGTWVDVPLPAGVTLAASSDVAVARTLENGAKANLMFTDTAGRAWFQVRHNPNMTSSWRGQEPSELITTGARTVSLSSAGAATQIFVTRVYPQP